MIMKSSRLYVRKRASQSNSLKASSAKRLNITEDAKTKPDTLEQRASSPESNCSICLGQMEDKSFTDRCFHMFCFSCLTHWARINPVCPLCKQAFYKIYHNIKSLHEYEEYNFVPDRPQIPMIVSPDPFLIVQRLEAVAENMSSIDQFMRSEINRGFLDRLSSNLLLPMTFSWPSFQQENIRPSSPSISSSLFVDVSSSDEIISPTIINDDIVDIETIDVTSDPPANRLHDITTSRKPRELASRFRTRVANTNLEMTNARLKESIIINQSLDTISLSSDDEDCIQAFFDLPAASTSHQTLKHLRSHRKTRSFRNRETHRAVLLSSSSEDEGQATEKGLDLRQKKHRDLFSGQSDPVSGSMSAIRDAVEDVAVREDKPLKSESDSVGVCMQNDDNIVNGFKKIFKKHHTGHKKSTKNSEDKPQEITLSTNMDSLSTACIEPTQNGDVKINTQLSHPYLDDSSDKVVLPCSNKFITDSVEPCNLSILNGGTHQHSIKNIIDHLETSNLVRLDTFLNYNNQCSETYLPSTSVQSPIELREDNKSEYVPDELISAFVGNVGKSTTSAYITHSELISEASKDGSSVNSLNQQDTRSNFYLEPIENFLFHQSKKPSIITKDSSNSKENINEDNGINFTQLLHECDEDLNRQLTCNTEEESIDIIATSSPPPIYIPSDDDDDDELEFISENFDLVRHTHNATIIMESDSDVLDDMEDEIQVLEDTLPLGQSSKEMDSAKCSTEEGMDYMKSEYVSGNQVELLNDYKQCNSKVNNFQMTGVDELKTNTLTNISLRYNCDEPAVSEMGSNDCVCFLPPIMEKSFTNNLMDAQQKISQCLTIEEEEKLNAVLINEQSAENEQSRCSTYGQVDEFLPKFKSASCDTNEVMYNNEELLNTIKHVKEHTND